MNTFFIFIKLVINYRLKEDQIKVPNLKMIQRNLEKTNFYTTKSSVQQTIFFTLVIVKCMEKNLDITKPCIANTCYQSLGPDFFISRFHCTVPGKEASSSTAPVIVKTLTRLKLARH